MSKIFLVRHGETDWNRERRVLGRSEVPLNSTGVSQVKDLASFLPVFKIHTVYSSPLKRTIQTAKVLSSHLGIKLESDSHFTEADTGLWEGHLWKEFDNDPVKKDYYLYPETVGPPNGETFSQVIKRAVLGVESLLHRHTEGGFLIVTHSDLIRSILCHYLKVDITVIRKFWIDHASLTSISIDQDSAIVHFLNLLAGKSRF